jgi:hypothetical protein
MRKDFQDTCGALSSINHSEMAFHTLNSRSAGPQIDTKDPRSSRSRLKSRKFGSFLPCGTRAGRVQICATSGSAEARSQFFSLGWFCFVSLIRRMSNCFQDAWGTRQCRADVPVQCIDILFRSLPAWLCPPKLANFVFTLLTPTALTRRAWSVSIL